MNEFHSGRIDRARKYYFMHIATIPFGNSAYFSLCVLKKLRVRID